MPSTKPQASRRGATLVEAVLAIVILSIAATGFFSVAISMAHTRRSVDPHEEALEAAESLADRLRLYVTADHSDDTKEFAPGPAGSRSWSIPCEGCPDTWALAPGEHDVTTLLPQDLRDRHPGATLTYRVTGSALTITVKLPPKFL